MAKTDLTVDTPFVANAVGNTEIWLVTGTVTTKLAPTRAEIDAATTLNLGETIADVTGGFSESIQSATGEKWGSGKGFVEVVSVTPDMIVIETWADRVGGDIRDEIAVGDRMTIVRSHAGDTATATASTWDCVLASMIDIGPKNEFARVRLTFSVKDYDLDFAIPAAA